MKLNGVKESFRNNRGGGRTFKTAGERNAAFNTLKEDYQRTPLKVIRRALDMPVTPRVAEKLRNRLFVFSEDYGDRMLPEKTRGDDGSYRLEYVDDMEYYGIELMHGKIKEIDDKGVWLDIYDDDDVRDGAFTFPMYYVWEFTPTKSKVLYSQSRIPILFFGEIYMRKANAAQRIQRAYRRYQDFRIERAKIQRQRNRIHNELRSFKYDAMAKADFPFHVPTSTMNGSVSRGH